MPSATGLCVRDRSQQSLRIRTDTAWLGWRLEVMADMRLRLLCLSGFAVALICSGIALSLAWFLTRSSPPATFLRMSLGTDWRLAAGRLYWVRGRDLRNNTSLKPARIRHERFGVSVERRVGRYFEPSRHGAFVMTVVSVPCLYPATLTMTGGIALLVVLRRWRVGGPNACHCCGYDLRASGLRCPECGTERARDTLGMGRTTGE
jgi:hypothetical protein